LVWVAFTTAPGTDAPVESVTTPCIWAFETACAKTTDGVTAAKTNRKIQILIRIYPLLLLRRSDSVPSSRLTVTVFDRKTFEGRLDKDSDSFLSDFFKRLAL
jgi:hypothetical protein